MAAQILGRFVFTRSTVPGRPQNLCFLFSTSPPPLDGPPPDTKISATVSVLIHLRSKSRWSHLRALCPDGFSPSEFSQIVIRIRNNARLALRFFDFTRRHSLCEHSLDSYAALIHVLSRARLKGQACSVIKEAMRVSPVPEPVQFFEVLVKMYRECGSAPFVFDLLIQCCLDAKKLDGAVEIARLLMSRGISPNVGTCNSLIQCASRSRGALAGYDIYKELFGLGYADANAKGLVRVRPNVHTFNTLMLCCYRDGAVDRVKELRDEMRNSSCAPNACSYSMLMAVHCEEGNLLEAERIWNEMRSDGIEADAAAYNTIIGGFCEAGEVERAEEFFREMESGGVESTRVTCEHLISGYCKKGDVDTAMLLYKDMLRKNFFPEESAIDALVERLCEKGRVLEALNMMRRARGNLHVSPKVTSYEVLLRGLCAKGEMEEALGLQAEMVGRGFRPSLQVYSAFIDGYAKRGNWEMGEKLRKEMAVLWCEPLAETSDNET